MEYLRVFKEGIVYASVSNYDAMVRQRLSTSRSCIDYKRSLIIQKLNRLKRFIILYGHSETRKWKGVLEKMMNNEDGYGT